MTISHEVTVWCDKCANWDQSGGTAREFRRQLHRLGWITVAGPNGPEDYCPHCHKESVDQEAMKTVAGSVRKEKL